MVSPLPYRLCLSTVNGSESTLHEPQFQLSEKQNSDFYIWEVDKHLKSDQSKSETLSLPDLY